MARCGGEGRDRGLRQVIRLGIPESGMLAFDFDAAEMTGIVAYLRNMNYEADAVALGDPARGRAVFTGRGTACAVTGWAPRGRGWRST